MDHTGQFPPELGEGEPMSLLTPDGHLADGARTQLTTDEVTAALRLMLLGRIFDRRAFSLQRQGRFGTYSPIEGQEASVVGAAMTLDRARDWIVPQYREMPALVHHGLPLENFAMYFMGHPAGGRIPDDVNVLPVQIALAAQLPQATGVAWGLQRRRTGGVVLAFCGDGATSEGDFHEACNLAGVLRAPIVFVVSNNGWAISTPRRLQSASASFAVRAAGYGFPGVLVDGNDLLAVQQAVSAAVERARAGHGPTLVETTTYRMGAHNTADDPTRYRDEDERAAWSELDPIMRVRRYLAAQQALDDAGADALAAEVEAEIDRAMQHALDQPPATAGDLFDHTYATDTPRLAAQRRAWTAAGDA